MKAKNKSATKPVAVKRSKPKTNPLDPKPKKTAAKKSNKPTKTAGAGAFNGATSNSKKKKPSSGRA